MRLSASLLLETNSLDPVPCIFMLHPQSAPGQGIESNELKTSVPCTFIAYTDIYGNLCQRTTVPPGLFTLESRIVASCADQIAVDPEAAFTPMEEIPNNVLQFLLPSRYCEADRLGGKAREITARAVTGYEQVDSIRQWIHFQKDGGGIGSGLQTEIVNDQVFFPEFNMMISECLFITLQTIDIHISFGCGRNMDNFFAPLANQMGSGFITRFSVID